MFHCSTALQYGRVSFSHMQSVMGQLCLNTIQFPAKFLKRESPAAPCGTTEISLSDNVAYESYSREKDQDDDHHYEKLDEYKA